jgi:hypothetical protein
MQLSSALQVKHVNSCQGLKKNQNVVWILFVPLTHGSVKGKEGWWRHQDLSKIEGLEICHVCEMHFTKCFDRWFNLYRSLWRSSINWKGNYRYWCINSVKVKVKEVLLQAWDGPECSRKLRFADFVTTAPNGVKVVSPTHWPYLPPENSPGTHFC